MNRNMVKGLLVLALAIPLMSQSTQALAAFHIGSQAYPPGFQVQEATVTIDNVTVVIRTPYPITAQFTSSQAGDATQAGGASENRNQLNYLAIIAVPFGTAPPTEAVLAAEHGEAQSYLASMRSSRKQYEVEFQPNGPTIMLFGQKATGQVTLLSPNAAIPKPQLYVEWVVEAGPRIWIVRIVKQLPDGTTDLASQAAFLQSLESLTLSSNTLDNPSTLKPGFGFGTPTPTPPGMPPTGAASAEDGLPGLLALVAALTGGLLALGGVALRSGGRFGRVK